MEGAVNLKYDPSVVYNYQEILSLGTCHHCGKYLQWKLEVKNDDDRFCHAICCATRYSMVPEKVRVLATFAFPLDEKEEKEEELSDEADFLKELQSL